MAFALAAFYVLSVGAAYRAGLSQNAVEIGRLLADLEDQREVGRKTSVQLAALEQKLERERAAAASPPPVTAEDLPPPIRPLALLVQRKLAAGVEPARIAQAIDPLARERSCAPGTETRRLLLATPISRDSGAARFAAGPFEITGKGVSVRDAQGRAEAWFDPAQPVELALRGPGGAADSVAGVLPLEHGVVLDGKEYLFRAEASRRRGFVELYLQVCDYP
ncbi:hypothetical protein [Marinimicrococcus flavescens]|uniref:Uncharacterized protein n=1 Tax=Marinimicrococcus flavescens TaxID=3031815 RepID=A0AAP3XQM8_9PROT|nr:hypothetical protein [Marinimicrococcus flavescens]